MTNIQKSTEMTTTLYRVTRRTTGSLQPSPSHTSWTDDIIYCGYDRDEARRIYHESTPSDEYCGYGNRATETLCEVIADGDSDDFADDTIAAEVI